MWRSESCGGCGKCVGAWGEVMREVWRSVRGDEEKCWGVGEIEGRCGKVWGR